MVGKQLGSLELFEITTKIERLCNSDSIFLNNHVLTVPNLSKSWL